MSEEEKKQAIKGKYFEFQLLQQHIKEVQKQLQIFTQQNIELLNAKESLNSLQNVELNKEIYSQISSGILIKTFLKDNKSVLINIGANVVVSKTISEAEDLISKQSDELSMTIEKIEEQLNKADLHLQNLQEEIQHLSESS